MNQLVPMLTGDEGKVSFGMKKKINDINGRNNIM